MIEIQYQFDRQFASVKFEVVDPDKADCSKKNVLDVSRNPCLQEISYIAEHLINVKRPFFVRHYIS